jgi:hypothetical protein
MRSPTPTRRTLPSGVVRPALPARRPRPRILRAAAAAAIVAACARTGEPGVSVSILTPADGDTVRGTAVRVTLAASGIELAPAAEQRVGTAHHHLFLDVDVGTTDVPIPAGVGGVVHLGKAETAYRFDSVAAGPHRLIAVLADPTHLPLRPLVADTVRFVVLPP